MATLQKKMSHGCAYWYVVECRRINGKPRPIVLAYLGSTERLVNQLLAQARAGSLRITSYAHGAVAALWQVASEIGLIPLLNQHLPAQQRDGLSVGETLTLAAIHRVLKPASKRSFSEWAATTTLPALARFSPPAANQSALLGSDGGGERIGAGVNRGSLGPEAGCGFGFDLGPVVL